MAVDHDDDDSAGWSLTESDPSVFTALLDGLGVRGLQVEDLWSLDDGALAELGDIKAFIFLFKYVGGLAESDRAGELDPTFPGFFCHQVINNACGSLALLNTVFNLAPSADWSLGPDLSGLREFGQGMDPESLGYAIGNSDKIRDVHNSFARADPFAHDPSLGGSTADREDAFHFVAYLPSHGRLYELDGLQPFPRSHGSFLPPAAAGATSSSDTISSSSTTTGSDSEPPTTSGGEGWLAKAREVIQARIGSYPEGSLHFSLLGLTADPLPRLERALASASATNDPAAEAVALGRLEDERQKRRRWAFENSLRRHNHISLAHQLLLALARAGKLTGAVAAAEAKGQARRAKKAAAQRRGAKREGDPMEE